jgi:hypothetical protein
LNCFWDVSDSNQKCKTKISDSTDKCFNSDHYRIDNSNCTLLECVLRTAKTSGSNECGDDCYLEGNSCVSYCQIYSKPINNLYINCANITADNESSCSDIIGYYFESGKD